MSDKIVDMITQLVATGSNTALYFYAIYVVGSVLKFVIGFGCLLLSVKKICAAIREAIK
jgi:hypothetical protein